jgi:hypothetical protein
MAKWWTYLWWSLRLYILCCSLTVILLWRWYTCWIGHSDQLVSHMIIISIARSIAPCSLSLIDKLRGSWYLGPSNYLALSIWRNGSWHPLIRGGVWMCGATLDTHTRILWILIVSHWYVRRVRYVYSLPLHKTSASCLQWIVEGRSETCHLLLKYRYKRGAFGHAQRRKNKFLWDPIYILHTEYLNAIFCGIRTIARHKVSDTNT